MKGMYLNNGSLAMVLTALLVGGAVAQDGAPARRRAAEGAQAGRMPRGGEGMDQGMMLTRMLSNPRIAEQLGVSEAQTAKLAELMDPLDEKQTGLSAALREAATRQTEMLADADSAEDALMEVVEEIGALRTDLAKLSVKRMLAIREVMTPEQIEQARTTIRNRMVGAARERGVVGGDAEGARREGDRGERQRGDAEGERRRRPAR